MSEPSGKRLLWRTIARLDEVERQLLKPEPSGLGALVENLEACWRELSSVEDTVRASGGAPEWRKELEDVRGRVSRLAMLLDHAREMLGGWRAASVGIYGADGAAGTVEPIGRGDVGRGLDEEG